MMVKKLIRDWSFLNQYQDVPTLLAIGLIAAYLDAHIPRIKRIASAKTFLTTSPAYPFFHMATLLTCEEYYLLLVRLSYLYALLAPEDRAMMETISAAQQAYFSGDIETFALLIEMIVEKIYVDLAATARYAGGV